MKPIKPVVIVGLGALIAVITVAAFLAKEHLGSTQSPPHTWTPTPWISVGTITQGSQGTLIEAQSPIRVEDGVVVLWARDHPFFRIGMNVIPKDKPDPPTIIYIDCKNGMYLNFMSLNQGETDPTEINTGAYASNGIQDTVGSTPRQFLQKMRDTNPNALNYFLGNNTTQGESIQLLAKAFCPLQ